MKTTFLLIIIVFFNLLFACSSLAKGTEAPFVALGQGTGVPAITSPTIMITLVAVLNSESELETLV